MPGKWMRKQKVQEDHYACADYAAEFDQCHGSGRIRGAATGIILGILEFGKGRISLEECFFMIMISAEFFLPLRLLGSFFKAINGNAAADKDLPASGCTCAAEGDGLSDGRQ